MTFTGSIYLQTCGDYRIHISYSPLGEFCTIRHQRKIIGYETDSEKAKEVCEAHRAKEAA